MPTKNLILIRCTGESVHALACQTSHKMPHSKSLTHEYQALFCQKEALNEKLDNIEDEFISKETPLYKKRVLDIYKKMAPAKVPMLERILANISYGPIKIASLPLIDGGYQRFGSLLYYKYRSESGNDYPIILIAYQSTLGKPIMKLYSLQLHNKVVVPPSDTVPAYWFESLGVSTSYTYDRMLEEMDNECPLNVRSEYQLVAFLAVDRDLDEFGDMYGAIPEYYDIQEKLKTDAEYYWLAVAQSPRAVASVEQELRQVIEENAVKTVHDLTQGDWEQIQATMQKAFMMLHTQVVARQESEDDSYYTTDSE